MARPSDQREEGELTTDPSSELRGTAKKVGMIDPGFRESQEESILQPRILGLKKPSNPHDRRNLIYLGVAFVVALVIFAILEFKDIYAAAREAKHAAKEMIQSQ